MVADARGRRRAGASSASASARCCCGRERPIVLAPRRAGAPVARVGRAGRAGARRDAARTRRFITCCSPTAGTHARDDQRQRLRRADRLPRRGRARAARRRSPTCCSCTTARSRRAPTTRSCASSAAGRRRAACSCGARAGTCPRACRSPGAPTRPLLACGAELKNTFCVAKGARAWVSPPHRRPRELRDAALVHRGDRALRAAVRGRARGRRPRPAPRVPLDQVRARARGRRARRRPAPPRAPGGVPRRARRAGAGGRARSSTAPATAPTAPSGAASCSSATSRTSERVGSLLAGAAAGRRARDPRAVADGVRVAARERATGGEPRELPPRAARARSTTRALAAGRRGSRASGLGVAVDHEHGPPVRRRRARCAGCAHASTTRARRRSSSRRRATRSSGAATRSRWSASDGAVVIDPRETIRARRRRPRTPGVAVGDGREPLPRGARARDGRGAALARPSAQGTELVVLSGGVFQNRRLLEAAADGPARGRAAGARARAAAGRRRRDLLRPGGGRRPANDGLARGTGVAEVTQLNAERERLVARSVFIRGANRPFGELTLEDVRIRADELRSVTGWGPTVRVAPVARAWRELAIEMERCGSACVSELDAAVLDRARAAAVGRDARALRIRTGARRAQPDDREVGERGPSKPNSLVDQVAHRVELLRRDRAHLAAPLAVEVLALAAARPARTAPARGRGARGAPAPWRSSVSRLRYTEAGRAPGRRELLGRHAARRRRTAPRARAAAASRDAGRARAAPRQRSSRSVERERRDVGSLGHRACAAQLAARWRAPALLDAAEVPDRPARSPR